MTQSNSWGPCVSCKWWQIEPDSSIEKHTIGQCIDEDLQSLQLRVSGNSGCSHYMNGEPARGKGSSEQPPAAPPSH